MTYNFLERLRAGESAEAIAKEITTELNDAIEAQKNDKDTSSEYLQVASDAIIKYVAEKYPNIVTEDTELLLGPTSIKDLIDIAVDVLTQPQTKGLNLLFKHLF